MARKRIFSRASPHVWLATSSGMWSMLPFEVKRELLQAIETVAAIRCSIALAAKVETMPPVEIVLEIWRSAKNDATIDGMTWVLAVSPYFVLRRPIASSDRAL